MNIICEGFKNSEEEMMYHYNELIRCYMRFGIEKQMPMLDQMRNNPAYWELEDEEKKLIYNDYFFEKYCKCRISSDAFITNSLSGNLPIQGILETHDGGYVYRSIPFRTDNWTELSSSPWCQSKHYANGRHYYLYESIVSLHNNSQEKNYEIYDDIMGCINRVFNRGDLINYFIADLGHENCKSNERDVLSDVALEIGFRMSKIGKPFMFIRC